MSRAIYLTGTNIIEAEKQVLTAGLLEVTFNAGALRWVRWNGVEILRAVMFLVRTPGWGTPVADIRDLDIKTTDDSFRISYNAHYSAADAGVLAKILFEGHANGTLKARADIHADVPFETNRTGFVILHPLLGFAGSEVEVEHASAGVQRLKIPAIISPGQPVLDMQAITHEPRAGLRVTTRFTGDIFEMEDHRNWSDASFKTYSRPISLPYPYLLNPDEPVTQGVEVSIADDGNDVALAIPIEVPAINGQRLPIYALPLDRPDDVKQALSHVKLLKAVAPARFLLRHDTSDAQGQWNYSDLADLLKQTAAALEVQLLLHGVDAAGADKEIAALAHAFSATDITVTEISAFAKIDEQSFQPDEARPAHPSEATISASLSKHFNSARRGGGTPAFFTELNRKRPDPSLSDFISFATTPMVHAADDVSVMETLQSLPHILNSATALSGALPLAVGPTGIGARLNPYGSAPNDNAPDQREGMAAHDPRQRGLFAAAWHVGYLAQLAPWDVERFAFGAPTGAFGLVSAPQSWERTAWDELPEGALYPLYHVARWISQAASGEVLAANIENNIAQVEWQKNGRHYALFANLGLTPQGVSLSRFIGAKGQLLDAATFKDAALSADSFTQPQPQPMADEIVLDAYAVLHIIAGETK